ncbi:MAG: menaquinone biosynthesis decarboxylase [Geobacteraceae bacterium GWC2_58_44]|nr:MAG: menaquinone biosynthesis decarboxylase [Geobacteraceae bacterium GWC2_58_44]HBG04146.1 menaquinone biosynthesis decarboxylase [Geobacter sp.]
MAYRDLRDFLARLDALGELQRVDAEVDPDLEIAAITDRHSKAPGGGKALLFSRVKGSRYPVATNLYGSHARMALALEVASLGELTGRMERLLGSPDAAPLPARVDGAPCQEIVQQVPDLLSYPFLKSWPGDGGRFITLPLVFTQDPETGAANCGMYRVRLFDDSSAGIRWKPGSGGFGHCEKYAAAGLKMPVAIAVGAIPSLTLAASLPLPEPFDELSFAGFLGGEPVEMTRCLTSGLSVPARAELVIEGHIEPGETRSEGRFGNHTGRYDQGEQVPVLRVSCITHRSEPICQATVVGPPPMEDCYLAKAAERLLVPFSRRQCPEIVDITLPMEGIFHGCAVIAIRKTVAGQGRRVLESLRDSGWLKRGKLLVVVDAADAALTLPRAFWQALNGARFPRDLLLSEGSLGIDATRKFPEEGGEREFQELGQDPFVSALVERRWREYGFL